MKDLEFDYEKGFQKVNEITAIDLQGNKIPLILKCRKDRSEFAFYEEFLSNMMLILRNGMDIYKLTNTPFYSSKELHICSQCGEIMRAQS